MLNPLDMPNDFFRIHLVCGLLDTCGQCFDRGSARKKLDQFLAYFQVPTFVDVNVNGKYYIHTKDQLSMDAKFEVQDMIEKIRPNAKVHESLEEAAEALNEIVAKQAKPMGAMETVGEGSDGVSEKSDDEGERTRVDDEELEEEEEKLDDMEVTCLPDPSNSRAMLLKNQLRKRKMKMSSC
jgi:regulator of nonsense transcripts 2